MLIANANAARGPYPADLKAIMNIARAHEGRAWLSSWRALRDTPTPLYDMAGIAAGLRLAKVWVKDESVRSPLGSFKALGAPIALVRLLMRLWPDPRLTPEKLLAGQYAELLESYTVISATDGNHGRALAAAARSIGCACVIVLHATVSAERERAIADYGARIVRTGGDYDDAVREAARLAADYGWCVVSDTSYQGYEDIPRDVMQGYATIAAEIVEQAAGMTHIFLQGGVGGLAAGIVSYLWEYYGDRRPALVVVEPRQADCLYQSARLGRPCRASGAVDSIMAGLACGEASPLAWRFLHPGAHAFMTISDDDAIDAVRLAAAGSALDRPLVMGESGAAGLAGLLALRGDAHLSKAVGLDQHARVMLVNTEGATAPALYQLLTGETAEAVLARQAAWATTMDLDK